MSLKIDTLKKDGDAEKEYIKLKATADVDIGNYAIIDKTFNNNGSVSNVHKHFYRFPSKVIKKGEFVTLRTGKGKNIELITTNGVKVHRCYWGSDAAFWNDSNTEKAELLKVTTIDTKVV